MAKRSDDEILRDLGDVECELSPENLSCDGECSSAETRRREKALLARKKALVAELGRTPTDDDLRKIYGS